MGVFYTFSPKLKKSQVDEFLNAKNIQFDLYNEDHRMVIELQNLADIDYLLFYYENENSLVAHSSHDLSVIQILNELKDRFNLKIDSDNEEFEVL
jgi:hypothetical protein